MRDPEGLEDLAPGGVVVAAQVEEILKDLGGKGAALLDRPLQGSEDAMTADAADLALLVLVIVSTHIARVLSLPLPHRNKKEFLDFSEIPRTQPSIQKAALSLAPSLFSSPFRYLSIC